MEERYLIDPQVARMVKLAIRRKRHLFEGCWDIDDESLFADLMGDVAKAFYNPTKSQPHTFAYRVAWARLIDLNRRRTLYHRKLDEGRQMGEVRRGAIETDDVPEEAAESIYADVKLRLKQKGIPLRDPHCGSTYLNRAQRLTLHVLQEKMGWSSRQARDALIAHPGILQVIGATQPLSDRFFCRAAVAATQLHKFFAVPA